MDISTGLANLSRKNYMMHEDWVRTASRGKEDEILLEYWQEVGGLIFAEVVVGGRGQGSRWPKGSKARRIDALRFSNFEALDLSPGIVTYRRENKDFIEELIQKSTVEMIEIKEKLGRYVIGQAIIGVDLLELRYGDVDADAVILCRVGDPLLEMICQRHAIQVWKAG